MTGRRAILFAFLFGLIIAQSSLTLAEDSHLDNEDYEDTYYDEEDSSLEMNQEKAEVKAVIPTEATIPTTTTVSAAIQKETTTVVPTVVQKETTTVVTTAAPKLTVTNSTTEKASVNVENWSEEEKETEGSKGEHGSEEAQNFVKETNFDVSLEKQAELDSDVSKLEVDENSKGNSNSEPKVDEKEAEDEERVISLIGDEISKNYDSYYEDLPNDNPVVEFIVPNEQVKAGPVVFPEEEEAQREGFSLFGPRYVLTTARTDHIYSGIFIGFLALTFATILFAFYRGFVWFNQRMRTEIVYERMEQGGEPVFQTR